MHRRYAKGLCSFVMAAGFVSWCLPSSADTPPRIEDEICSLASDLQGRIQDIIADAGVPPTVNIERGGQPREARIGCLVRAGDIVRPRPGTRVFIMLRDGEVKTINFNEPMVIPPAPALRPSGGIEHVLTVLRELAGADASEARKVALGTIGATRSPNGAYPPVTLPGLFGLGQQYVDGGRSLHVRWNGGAAPFRIDLVPAQTSDRAANATLTTSERFAQFDLSRHPAGNYDLTIAGTDIRPLTLRLHITTASEVPSAQAIDPSADEEARELVEAVWLLTRAPSRWRLEALSRLETLASEHDDVIAQVILDPALPVRQPEDR
jgi:hypothetical protein